MTRPESATSEPRSDRPELAGKSPGEFADHVMRKLARNGNHPDPGLRDEIAWALSQRE